jgi:diguanylate cyclase (GGDEF)-like protein
VKQHNELSQLAQTYQAEPEKALCRAREIADEALAQKQTDTAALALFVVGECLLYRADYHQAQTALERALFLLDPDHPHHLRILTSLGKQAFLSHNLTSALQIFYDAQHTAMGLNDMEALTVSFLYIGRILKIGNHAGRALEMLTNGYEAAEVNGNPAHLALADLFFGEYYLAEQELERAIEYTRQAISRFQDLRSVDLIDAQLQLVRIHIASREFQKSQPLATEALRQARIKKLPYQQAKAVNLFGKIYEAQERAERALLSYRHSYCLAEAYQFQSLVNDNVLALMHQLYAAGQIEESFAYGRLLWEEASRESGNQMREHITAIEEQHTIDSLKRERDLFKKRSRELEQDKRSIHLLSQAVHEIVSSVNADLAFQALEKSLKRMIDYDALALSLIDPDTGELSISHSVVNTSKDYAAVYQEFDHHSRSCLSSGSMIHIRQGGDQGFSFQSAAAVPLQSRGDDIGVLTLLSRKAFRFSANEIDVLSTLTDFLSISLANYQMMLQLKQKNALLLEKQQSLASALQELQTAHDEIEHLATYDQLTGLPNRYLLERRMEEIIALAKRTKTPFALFFIDLDNFKELNDTFGHRTGDSALRLAAKRMKEVVRTSDLVARVGGDEFIAVFNTTKSMQNLSFIAEKLIKSLSQPLKFGNGEINLQGSIGISLYPADGLTFSELSEKADRALYRSKQAGKGAFEFYSKYESYDEVNSS